MKLLGWILAALYFLAVVVFALNNAIPVPLRLTSTRSLGEVPLVVVVLACFVVGIVFGVLALAPRLIRLHREASRLRRLVGAEPALAAASPVERASDRLVDAARNIGAVGAIEDDPRGRR